MSEDRLNNESENLVPSFHQGESLILVTQQLSIILANLSDGRWQQGIRYRLGDQTMDCPV